MPTGRGFPNIPSTLTAPLGSLLHLSNISTVNVVAERGDEKLSLGTPPSLLVPPGQLVNINAPSPRTVPPIVFEMVPEIPPPIVRPATPPKSLNTFTNSILPPKRAKRGGKTTRCHGRTKKRVHPLKPPRSPNFAGKAGTRSPAIE